MWLSVTTRCKDNPAIPFPMFTVVRSCLVWTNSSGTWTDEYASMSSHSQFETKSKGSMCWTWFWVFMAYMTIRHSHLWNAFAPLRLCASTAEALRLAR